MDSSVKKYLSEIGRRGGISSSVAKAKSSAENGKLGGRPKAISERTDGFGVPGELTEMARVGTQGQYSFWVYTEPLKNPSFHLKHKTDFEIVLQMKDLKILEIKNNESRFKFKKGELPPKEILNVVTTFLDSKNAKIPKVTNRDTMGLFWEALNG